MADVLSFRDITGQVLTLSAPLRVSQYSGFGPPSPRALVQREVYRSGQRTRYTAWEPRVIQLTIEVTPGAGETLEDLRDQVNAFLTQLSAGIWLSYLRTDGRLYETFVRLGAGLASPRAGSHGPHWQRLVLTLVADDPWWYGPSESWVFSIGGGAGAWGFPMGLPEGFGASITDLTETRTYSGQEDTYPIIQVRGPATDILIENLTLGTTLDLTTYAVASGETVTIDLREDYKTITTTAGSGSLLPYLTEASHLGTWRIGAHPVPPGGQNTLHIHMENVAVTSLLSMTFRSRYLSA